MINQHLTISFRSAVKRIDWIACKIKRGNFHAINSVNSLYKEHYRDLELVSSLERLRNSGSLFHFTWDLAAALIIGVSVIMGCPQGEI